MPVIRATEATVHEMHGSRFTSYVAPAHGSSELCAWRLEVPPGSRGVRHQVSHEEVLLMTGGTLRVAIDGQTAEAGAGDAVLVPAGASVRIDNPGSGPAAAVVATSVGLTAVLGDGTRVTPPWCH